MEILLSLKEDRALQARIGAAARKTMESRYGETQLEAIANHYLRDPAQVAV